MDPAHGGQSRRRTPSISVEGLPGLERGWRRGGQEWAEYLGSHELQGFEYAGVPAPAKHARNEGEKTADRVLAAIQDRRVKVTSMAYDGWQCGCLDCDSCSVAVAGLACKQASVHLSVLVLGKSLFCISAPLPEKGGINYARCLPFLRYGATSRPASDRLSPSCPPPSLNVPACLYSARFVRLQALHWRPLFAPQSLHAKRRR